MITGKQAELVTQAKRHLMQLAEMFSGSHDKKIGGYATRLIQQGYPVSELERACEIILRENKYFPSYSELLVALGKRKTTDLDSLESCDQCGHTGRVITSSGASHCYCPLGMYYGKNPLYFKYNPGIHGKPLNKARGRLDG